MLLDLQRAAGNAGVQKLLAEERTKRQTIAHQRTRYVQQRTKPIKRASTGGRVQDSGPAGRVRPAGEAVSDGGTVGAVAVAAAPGQQTLQRREREGATASSPWNGLGEDLKQTLRRSYEILHVEDGAEYWIWNRAQYWSASQCFDAVDGARQSALIDVHRALRDQGLWTFVDHVVDFWPTKTRGIKFMPRDRRGLVAILSGGQQYCRDTLGASKTEPKWRQLTHPGSEALHFTMPSTGYCTAHLDRISPAKGRDKDGTCNYAIFSHKMAGIRHWWKEEKHRWD